MAHFLRIKMFFYFFALTTACVYDPRTDVPCDYPVSGWRRVHISNNFKCQWKPCPATIQADECVGYGKIIHFYSLNLKMHRLQVVTIL